MPAPLPSIAEALVTDLLGSRTSVALSTPGRTPTDRAGLAGQIEYTIACLRTVGLRPDSRVAVVLPGGPELAAALLGVAAATRCAPINPRATAEEIAFVLRDVAADAVIVPEQGHRAAQDAAAVAGCAILTLEAAGAAGRFVLSHDGAVIQPGDAGDTDSVTGSDPIALLLHTSGTTARPKLVALRHAQLLDSARAVARSLQLTPADRSLVVMPMFHVHGIVAALLAPLLSGGEVVVPVGFAGADLPALLHDTGATWLTAVPTILQGLLQQCERQPVAHSLRVVRACSSALPATVADGLERHLGVPVVEAYGMTEG
ncbi:MAG: AMP-binding protein, partial [Actinomycetota bacterium]